MKKICTLLFVSLLSFSSVKAVTHTVTVADFSFTPATITTVLVGDVIQFVWSSGNHNTTSGLVPSGAATWAAPINSTTTTFSYTVTVAGTYAYICTFHSTSMGGGFSASGTSINQLDLNVSTSVYPNPCKNKITVSYTSNVDAMTFYNIMGEEMQTVKLSPVNEKAEIDLSGLASGIYFYSTSKEGTLVETKKIVKSN